MGVGGKFQVDEINSKLKGTHILNNLKNMLGPGSQWNHGGAHSPNLSGLDDKKDPVRKKCLSKLVCLCDHRWQGTV